MVDSPTRSLAEGSAQNSIGPISSLYYGQAHSLKFGTNMFPLDLIRIVLLNDYFFGFEELPPLIEDLRQIQAGGKVLRNSDLVTIATITRR